MSVRDGGCAIIRDWVKPLRLATFIVRLQQVGGCLHPMHMPLMQLRVLFSALVLDCDAGGNLGFGPGLPSP